MKSRHAFAHIKMVLNAQAVAASHIRDCDRCSQIFGIAYDETMQSDATDPYEKLIVGLGLAPNTFRVTGDIWLELRACPNWPGTN